MAMKATSAPCWKSSFFHKNETNNWGKKITSTVNLQNKDYIWEILPVL